MYKPCQLDGGKATVLFQILDESLGVFRFKDMNESKWKYWAITRLRFINDFSGASPPVFWFRCDELDNCLLYCNIDGIYVTADAITPQKIQQVELCNLRLKKASLNEYDGIDDFTADILTFLKAKK